MVQWNVYQIIIFIKASPSPFDVGKSITKSVDSVSIFYEGSRTYIIMVILHSLIYIFKYFMDFSSRIRILRSSRFFESCWKSFPDLLKQPERKQARIAHEASHSGIRIARAFRKLFLKIDTKSLSGSRWNSIFWFFNFPFYSFFYDYCGGCKGKNFSFQVL